MFLLLDVVIVPRWIIQGCYEIRFPVIVTEAKLRKSPLHLIPVLSSYRSVDLAPSFWCFPNTVQARPELASKPTHHRGPETIYDGPVLILDESKCNVFPLGRTGFSLSTSPNVRDLIILRSVPFMSIPERY
jgi:hypothetical protein